MRDEAFVSRLENIISILKRQRSGAKNHTVTNLLQTAVLLLEVVISDDIIIEEKELHRMLKSVEFETGELFRDYGISKRSAGLPSV